MEKIHLANLPTKVYKLERLSKKVGKNIFIKRDDQTGSEISGNKIRKLEYALKDAVNKGCDTIITCGGIQSNHCRATSAAATMLGLKSILLLRISSYPKVEGNFFLDKLFGAQIEYCTPDEYRHSRNEIMEKIASDVASKGGKAYIVPEGASFGPGALGYIDCMKEIVKQEKELNIEFDIIVCAVGSGGTYAGLYIENKRSNLKKRIIGMAVCDDTAYFQNAVEKISHDAIKLIDLNLDINKSEVEINDKYVGIGYALSTEDELKFIADLASLEALVLDPVYTGKAMKGLCAEIENGNLKESENILFIHTGGLFGLFPKQQDFEF